MSTPLGAETPEPIWMKLGMVDEWMNECLYYDI